jgi:hypothetical protein
METTATEMEVRFPARRTLTSWVSPVRPNMMSSLRKPAFSAGEAAPIPVTTEVCRSSPLAREKKCCDHYF